MTWNLYKCLIKQSLKEVFAFRMTTVLIVVFGALFYLIEILTGFVYFNFTQNIAGWRLLDYFNLITSANIISYGYQFLFVSAHEELSDQIIEGQLDYTLIRPVNSYLYYALKRLDFPSLINFWLSIFVEIYIQIQYGFLGVSTYILYVLSVFGGIFFVFLINQIIVTLSFWINNLSALNGVPEYLMDASNRPYQIYPKIFQIFFMWIIPSLSATNLPVLLMKGGVKASWMLENILILIVLSLFSYVEWNLGLKHYVSAN